MMMGRWLCLLVLVVGGVSAKPVGERVTLDCAGIQLWAGGPFWASKNIGASKPEEYGYYFWWGDTVGYKRVGDKWVASDGSNNNFLFTEGNTPTCGLTDSQLVSSGWTTNGVLAPAHDAAKAHWGPGWRMPSSSELQGLEDNCISIWMTRNGVKGRLVKGKGVYSWRSIFFPAAGYSSGNALYHAGSYGYVWSSTPNVDGSSRAWYLYFYLNDFYVSSYYTFRYYGRSVRPVVSFTE